MHSSIKPKIWRGMAQFREMNPKLEKGLRFWILEISTPVILKAAENIF